MEMKPGNLQDLFSKHSKHLHKYVFVFRTDHHCLHFPPCGLVLTHVHVDNDLLFRQFSCYPCTCVHIVLSSCLFLSDLLATLNHCTQWLSIAIRYSPRLYSLPTTHEALLTQSCLINHYITSATPYQPFFGIVITTHQSANV